MTEKTTKTNSIKSKLKDGDIVLIKLVYEAEKRNNYGDIDTYANFHIIDNPHEDSCCILEEDLEDSDIHSILESPLCVGDKVYLNQDPSIFGEIKAIVEDKCWCLWGINTETIVKIGSLTKAS